MHMLTKKRKLIPIFNYYMTIMIFDKISNIDYLESNEKEFMCGLRLFWDMLVHVRDIA